MIYSYLSKLAEKVGEVVLAAVVRDVADEQLLGVGVLPGPCAAPTTAPASSSSRRLAAAVRPTNATTVL